MNTAYVDTLEPTTRAEEIADRFVGLDGGRTAFSVTVPIEAAPDWDEAIAQGREMEPTFALKLKRRWRDRLFSRPWRPWLNAVCYEGPGLLVNYALHYPTAELGYVCTGELTRRLVRA